MESTHERLEHIEHTQHAAHDPFTRNVAMTMALVAAALACVTMLSHRGHNRTLLLQNEANSLKTEADTLKTEANVAQARASDEWNFFQAKNIRKHEYDAFLLLLSVMTKDPSQAETCKKAEAFWKQQVAKYDKTDLPQQKAKAEGLQEERDEKLKEAVLKEREADEKIEESHHAHKKADHFDVAELGVELALVLCSISVLTKRKDFWLSGVVCGVVGVAIAAYAQFVLH